MRGHQQSVIRLSGAAGVTLVELIITLAVGAILLTVAVPSYQSFIANQRVKTASHELYASLLYARSEALKRNGDVFVTRNGFWANGWIVSTNTTRTYSECNGSPMPIDCLKVQGPMATVGITGGTAQLIYQRHGRATNAGSAFAICDTANSAYATRRTITIDPTGRPNIALMGSCG